MEGSRGDETNSISFVGAGNLKRKEVEDWVERLKADLSVFLKVRDLLDLILVYVEQTCEACHMSSDILFLLRTATCRYHPEELTRVAYGYVPFQWSCCQVKVYRRWHFPSKASYCLHLQKDFKSKEVHGCQLKLHTFIPCTYCIMMWKAYEKSRKFLAENG
jgi:hypothetical protein